MYFEKYSQRTINNQTNIPPDLKEAVDICWEALDYIYQKCGPLKNQDQQKINGLQKDIIAILPSWLSSIASVLRSSEAGVHIGQSSVLRATLESLATFIVMMTDEKYWLQFWESDGKFSSSKFIDKAKNIFDPQIDTTYKELTQMSVHWSLDRLGRQFYPYTVSKDLMLYPEHTSYHRYFVILEIYHSVYICKLISDLIEIVFQDQFNKSSSLSVKERVERNIAYYSRLQNRLAEITSDQRRQLQNIIAILTKT